MYQISEIVTTTATSQMVTSSQSAQPRMENEQVRPLKLFFKCNSNVNINILHLHSIIQKAQEGIAQVNEAQQSEQTTDALLVYQY